MSARLATATILATLALAAQVGQASERSQPDTTPSTTASVAGDPAPKPAATPAPRQRGGLIHPSQRTPEERQRLEDFRRRIDAQAEAIRRAKAAGTTSTVEQLSATTSTAARTTAPAPNNEPSPPQSPQMAPLVQ